VVSHGQFELVADLLADLDRCVSTPLRVILTLNIPESETPWMERTYRFEIEVVRNKTRKGFGANHNAALARTRTGIFCVINPDIRLQNDPFPALIAAVSDPGTGVATASVIGLDQKPEDHARRFPSLFTLAAKAFGHRPHIPPPSGNLVYHPDWVAGMFMLFRSETLRSVGGFDERYFLYYEDVDLCARLRGHGLDVAVCPQVVVIHAARRQSRRNLRYALWHLTSALRFLASRPRIALGLGPRRDGSA
jgi:GT2 family glycosyltransferase